MFRIFIIIALLFSSFSILAQNQKMLPYALNGKIDSQFYFINVLSKNQYDFKLIRKSNLELLRKNTMDTINALKTQIQTLNDASSGAVATTKSLQDSVSTLATALDVEKKRTDSISLLGMDFSKGSYHTFVWAIIIVLALILAGVLMAFRKAKVDAVDHKKTVDVLQEELQTTKKKAMEKEQLLKRQLLDEQLKKNS